jgi:hypothetical protein
LSITEDGEKGFWRVGTGGAEGCRSSGKGPDIRKMPVASLRRVCIILHVCCGISLHA